MVQTIKTCPGCARKDRCIANVFNTFFADGEMAVFKDTWRQGKLVAVICIQCHQAHDTNFIFLGTLVG
jgi:hypothetical protein